jgi:hypothetical protein
MRLLLILGFLFGTAQAALSPAQQNVLATAMRLARGSADPDIYYLTLLAQGRPAQKAVIQAALDAYRASINGQLTTTIDAQAAVAKTQAQQLLTDIDATTAALP